MSRETYNQAIDDVLSLLNTQIPKKNKSTYLVLAQIQSLKKPTGKLDCTKSIELWEACLAKHKRRRKAFRLDQVKISQAIDTYGEEAVDLAIVGATHEPVSDKFNPSQYLSLSRIFHPEKIERFINIGAAYTEKCMKEKLKEELDQKRLEEEAMEEVNHKALELVGDL